MYYRHKKSALEKTRTPKPKSIVAVNKQMNNSKLTATDISVLLYRVGKPPVMKLISTDLNEMQKLVGGYIEVIRLLKSNYVAIVNEEGRIRQLKPNRAVLMKNRLQGIYGDFFIAKGNNSGTISSITAEDVEKIREQKLVGGWDGETVFW